MLKKFFQAVADLINNVRKLASSFQEADEMVRDKFGLPPRADDNNQDQLEHHVDVPKLKKKVTLNNEENE